MSDPQLATPPAPPRRFLRVRTGRVVAGVFSGLGAYTGTDPVLWRIGFVIVTLATGGLALLAYLGAVLFVPEADAGEEAATARADTSTTARWVGIAALFVGGLILIHNVFDFRGGVFWGLVLIGVGVALWARNPSDEDEAAEAVAVPRPDAATTVAQRPLAPAAAVSAGAPTDPLPPVPPTPAAPPAPAPRPRRRRPKERSVLGRLVLGAATLVAGALILLDASEAVDVGPRAGASVVLAVIGAGLVIGAWWGRARWLIVPGAILAFLVVTVSTLPASFDAGAGQMDFRPTSLGDVRSDYRHGAGQMVVDLRSIEFTDRESIHVRLGVGEALVIVPDTVDVRVEGRVGIGEMNLLGHQSNGLGLRDSVSDAGTGPGELEIEGRVGLGQLTVARAGDASAIADAVRHGFRLEVETGRPDITDEEGSR